jgi:rhodanese-related sulfurtransferase
MLRDICDQQLRLKGRQMVTFNHSIPKLRRLRVLCLYLFLPVFFAIPTPFAAGPSLSDAEKHQRVMAMYAEYKKEFPGVTDIDAKAAIGLLSDPDVVFVDERKPEEQAISMIPGAITGDQFLNHLDQYRGNRIITYCTISYRSGKLADKLHQEGIFIVNLKGGLLGWVHAGGPLVREGQPVRKLHVYGRKWDLAPDTIETVY